MIIEYKVINHDIFITLYYHGIINCRRFFGESGIQCPVLRLSLQVELPPSTPTQRSQLHERQVSIVTLHGKLFLAVTKSPQHGQESYKTTEIGLYELTTESSVNKVRREPEGERGIRR